MIYPFGTSSTIKNLQFRASNLHFSEVLMKFRKKELKKKLSL